MTEFPAVMTIIAFPVVPKTHMCTRVLASKLLPEPWLTVSIQDSSLRGHFGPREQENVFLPGLLPRKYKYFSRKDAFLIEVRANVEPRLWNYFHFSLFYLSTTCIF